MTNMKFILFANCNHIVKIVLSYQAKYVVVWLVVYTIAHVPSFMPFWRSSLNSTIQLAKIKCYVELWFQVLLQQRGNC